MNGTNSSGLRSLHPLRDLPLVRVEYADGTEDVLEVADDGSYRSLRGLPPSDAAAEAATAFLDWFEHGIEHAAFEGNEWELAEAGRVLRGEHEVRCDGCGGRITRSMLCDGWEHERERSDRSHQAEPEYGYEHEVQQAMARKEAA